MVKFDSSNPAYVEGVRSANSLLFHSVRSPHSLAVSTIKEEKPSLLEMKGAVDSYFYSYMIGRFSALNYFNSTDKYLVVRRKVSL